MRPYVSCFTYSLYTAITITSNVCVRRSWCATITTSTDIYINRSSDICTGSIWTHIPRQIPEPINKSIIGGLDGAVLVRHVAHPGAVDQLLALEDTAQQQADNDQDDGDFHQGKTRLLFLCHLH